MALGKEVGLSPGDFVLDGDPAPSAIFGPFLLRPNGWMHQDSTWYGGIGLISEDPAPLPKGGRAPNFSAHVYCGQTAAWITVPLGTEEGLIPSQATLC